MVNSFISKDWLQRSGWNIFLWSSVFLPSPSAETPPPRPKKPLPDWVRGYKGGGGGSKPWEEGRASPDFFFTALDFLLQPTTPYPNPLRKSFKTDRSYTPLNPLSSNNGIACLIQMGLSRTCGQQFINPEYMQTFATSFK